MTTEQVHQHEAHLERIAWEACDRHGLFDGLDTLAARKVFDVGFRMGLRHPFGERDKPRPGDVDPRCDRCPNNPNRSDK